MDGDSKKRFKDTKGNISKYLVSSSGKGKGIGVIAT